MAGRRGRREVGLEYLREVANNRKLVPFVGAGVSKGAADLPTWFELVGAGLAFAQRLPVRERPSCAEVRAVEAAAAADNLLDALSQLQRLLARTSPRNPGDSPRYAEFLTEVFDEPEVRDASVLNALRALDPRVVITTNYDLLLETYNVVEGGIVATWQDPKGIRSMLRGGRGIVHLHGRYDLPRSVILTDDDYNRLVRVDDLGHVARAAFHSGVLMFVGTSLAGLEDPHIEPLLEAFAELSDDIGGEPFPHVALVHGEPDAEVVTRLRRLGVLPISFGDDHSDLSQFLAELSSGIRTQIHVNTIRENLRGIANAERLDEALNQVGAFLRDVVFKGRDVRVSYAEHSADLLTERLQGRYVIPRSASHNTFHYPVSVAAWALLEGRPIAWPAERDRLCDFRRIKQLGRYDRARELLFRDTTANEPELSAYIDVDVIRSAFTAETLTIGDLFQDWDGDQPERHYRQFVSLPVPTVDRFGKHERFQQHGVFNIDAGDEAPLLDSRAADLLRLAADTASLAYRLWGIA